MDSVCQPSMIEIKRFDEYWLDPVSELETRAGDVRWARAQFENELALPISCFFVMTQGLALLGYGGYWKVVPEAQLVNLVIDPAFRRQGFGKQLLQFMLKHARSEGCERCSLEVRASNAAAQSLYRKMGFQPVGLRSRMYEAPPDDAVLMEKAL